MSFDAMDVDGVDNLSAPFATVPKNVVGDDVSESDFLGFPYYRERTFLADDDDNFPRLWHSLGDTGRLDEAHNRYTVRDLGHHFIVRMCHVPPTAHAVALNAAADDSMGDDADEVIANVSGPFREPVTARILTRIVRALWRSMSPEDAAWLRSVWMTVWFCLHDQEALLPESINAARVDESPCREANAALGAARTYLRSLADEAHQANDAYDECLTHYNATADDVNVHILVEAHNFIRVRNEMGTTQQGTASNARDIRHAHYRMRRAISEGKERINRATNAVSEAEARVQTVRIMLESARTFVDDCVESLEEVFDTMVNDILGRGGDGGAAVAASSPQE